MSAFDSVTFDSGAFDAAVAYGIVTRLPMLGVSMGKDSVELATTLPTVTCTMGAKVGAVASINASLTTVTADLHGGVRQIVAPMPLVGVAMTGLVGSKATINAPLTRLESSIGARPPVVGQIDGKLTKMGVSMGVRAARVGSVSAKLSRLRVSMSGKVGNMGSINTTMPVTGCALTGYRVVTASINARQKPVAALLRGLG